MIMLGAFLLSPNDASAQFLKKLGQAVKNSVEQSLGIEKKEPQNNSVVNGNTIQQTITVSKEVEDLLKKAESGDAESMYKLGYAYQMGKGVDKNPAEGNNWFRKAAELGNGKAASDLGYNYENGIGADKDPAEANKWYRKGAELGDGEAAFSLGLNYENGIGVAQDYAEANKWYRKGVELGDGGAANNLGYNYAKGRGVTQDFAEANKWYRKGVELGNGLAARNLGFNYRDGNGVTKDIVEANKWFKKAVELGNKDAAKYIQAYDPTIEEAKKLTQGGENIIGNYKVTKNIFRLSNPDGGNIDVDPSIFKATLEQISFGNEGNTVLLTIQGKEDGKEINQTYCWSGSSVKIVPQYSNGMPMLLIMRGRTSFTACGGLVKADNGWAASLSTEQKAYTISSFRKGMLRSEVENIIKKDFGLSQFKFTRNSGNLKVYSFYWLDQAKRYNLFGDYHYELRNDKKYGDFYFDAQGKLVKWFLFM